MFTSLIVSASPSNDKPGPGNTGYRIPYDKLIPPDEAIHGWWNASTKTITEDKAHVHGIKFSGRVNLGTAANAVSGVWIEDCLFDGNNTTTHYLLACNSGNRARNVRLEYCEIRSTFYRSMVAFPKFLTIKGCHLWDSAEDAFSSFQWEDGCIVEDNYFHQLGKDKISHGDAIQCVGTGAYDHELTIRNNYFNMRKPSIKDGLGGSVENCYAPQLKSGCEATWTNYKPNSPIQFRTTGQGDVGNTASGTINVSGNWFNGWNTAQEYGDYPSAYPGSTNYTTVNIQNNKYERDFQHANFILNPGSQTCTVIVDYPSEVWEDTGESIKVAIDSGNGVLWNRYLCEANGNCPAGTWDDNRECTCWCGVDIVPC